jgi:hypothetical protein
MFSGVAKSGPSNQTDFQNMIATRQAATTPRVLSPRVLAKVVMAVLVFGQASHAGEVRFLPLTEEISERKLGLEDDKSVVPLADLNARKRSKAYICKSVKKPLTLVALDRERPNGKPAGVEIVLAPEMKSPLVLILADLEAPSGIRAIVIDDGSEGFPWGTLRFVNTAEKPYMIHYEKETKAIPGELKPFDVIPGGEARNIGIQLYSEDKPDTILYSAVWEHDPNLRKLVFIVPQADPAQQDLKLEIIPQDKRAKN